MILIAGGTGRFGRILVDRLISTGEPLRILSRFPARTSPPAGGKHVELVQTDVRDRNALDRAVAGARIVISAMSAFGMKGVRPRDVDFEGNANLVAAAEKHSAERFILISVLRASPDHRMELARMKYLAEQRLIKSNLAWTILRSATFTETFQDILCAPLLRNGKTIVFGHAHNPINFVSAHDLARFTQLAIADPSFIRTVTEIGGSENLSLQQFVDVFSSALGVTGKVRHIPVLAMKVLSIIARPFSPTFARMASASVLMDSVDMAFNATELQRRYPHVVLTTVAEAARRDYASRAVVVPVTP
jgi:uncharacterized protein YbjT (DUF2867 family)